MNLKQIKDAARQAFKDQQLQDTEGGVTVVNIVVKCLQLITISALIVEK